MKAFRAGVTAFFLVIVSGLSIAGAQDLKIPPAPDRWATDMAGFLSPETLQALDTKLESFEQQTGHQVIVYVGKTTGGYPIEEFADKAFQAWAVGRKGLDDGVALFIMAEDRAIRIEIGYGLESVIPDISAGRIVNDILIPKLRAGDADGAVSDAITAVLGAISGEPVQVEGARKEGRSAGKGLLIIAVIIFAIIFMTSPSLAFWLLINIFGGRGSGLRGSGSSGGGFRRSTSSGSFGGWSRGSSGGGFRSSGGGFRGGGGRSGGGGASGRW